MVTKYNWQELYTQYRLSHLTISAFRQRLIAEYGEDKVPSRSTIYKTFDRIKNAEKRSK